jgi:hypothetical protein
VPGLHPMVAAIGAEFTKGLLEVSFPGMVESGAALLSCCSPAT